ncbi:vacuolar protein sorting-associated protein 51 homolog [Actinidia eriantha]|uniref:vacuolar protein sorting-associated protein 51 homolog n=1 Tax=Actinidia eriantha TaxID=165200 RepID=UPI00258C158C|nr:vacuolar protein sorting-associated protein 51 homolog [Actinidia eriantha]XP_057509889.1 vacuolar protein sorting-associated protein 51 homolog [Actinidia eriantha]
MRRKKGVIWTDVLLMDEVLPEAALSDFSLEMPLQKSNVDPRREQKMNILCSLPLSKQKGSNRRQHRCPTGDFRQLLDDKMGLLVKLRDLIIDWVQEGFQDFFRKLDDHFLLLSGKTNSTGQDQGLTEGTSPERRTPKYKVLSGLVLVLAQLSVFIEQGGIPRITEEIAASFLVVVLEAMNMGPLSFLQKFVAYYGQLEKSFCTLKSVRSGCLLLMTPVMMMEMVLKMLIMPRG